MTPIKEEDFVSKKASVTRITRSHIFDIIGIMLVFASVLISLNIFKAQDFTDQTIGDIALGLIPTYLLSVLLTSNYYTKGTFAGKTTEKFVGVQSVYSDLVNRLDGDHVDQCDNFCKEYNEQALLRARTLVLKEAAICYEHYNEAWIDEKGEQQAPIKVWTKAQIVAKFGKIGYNCVKKARRCHIHGLSVPVLLGTGKQTDPTDLGADEVALKKKKISKTVISYLLIMILLALITVKDLTEWGWAAAFVIIFKAVYIFCRSYMAYFEGFEDITERITSHINRKTDLLKQFNNWYDKKINITEVE